MLYYVTVLCYYLIHYANKIIFCYDVIALCEHNYIITHPHGD